MKKKRKSQRKYEFMHGRMGLAILYGVILSWIAVPLTFLIVTNVPFLYRLFGENIVFTFVSVMFPGLAPIGFMFYQAPERLKINIKCTGIVYDDYVEIHKGKRVRIQYYKDIDIKRIFKAITHGYFVYHIGGVRIKQTIGWRKSHVSSDEQVDKFVGEVLNRVQKSEGSE